MTTTLSDRRIERRDRFPGKRREFPEKRFARMTRDPLNRTTFIVLRERPVGRTPGTGNRCSRGEFSGTARDLVAAAARGPVNARV